MRCRCAAELPALINFWINTLCDRDHSSPLHPSKDSLTALPQEICTGSVWRHKNIPGYCLSQPPLTALAKNWKICNKINSVFFFPLPLYPYEEKSVCQYSIPPHLWGIPPTTTVDAWNHGNIKPHLHCSFYTYTPVIKVNLKIRHSEILPVITVLNFSFIHANTWESQLRGGNVYLGS